MEKRPPPKIDLVLMSRGRPELVTSDLKTDLPEIAVKNKVNLLPLASDAEALLSKELP